MFSALLIDNWVIPSWNKKGKPSQKIYLNNLITILNNIVYFFFAFFLLLSPLNSCLIKKNKKRIVRRLEWVTIPKWKKYKTWTKQTRRRTKHTVTATAAPDSKLYQMKEACGIHHKKTNHKPLRHLSYSYFSNDKVTWFDCVNMSGVCHVCHPPNWTWYQEHLSYFINICKL